MAYGLGKIPKDRLSPTSKNPQEVDVVVECPELDPEPNNIGGIHFIPNAQGDWESLDGYYWAVVEYDPATLVMTDDKRGITSFCKIMEIQDPETLDPDKLLPYFDISKFNSRNAFLWAFLIGNHDVMIDKVTDSEWAYWWAHVIGNRDVMKSRITDLYWIRWWNIMFPDDQFDFRDYARMLLSKMKGMFDR